MKVGSLHDKSNHSAYAQLTKEEREFSPAGYQLIRSLTIENFRCFKKIELDDLGVINLLVGQNGSGKTAFLEALYLAIGAGPGLALRIRNWRGLGNAIMPGDRSSFESMWSDLFFHFALQSPIRITETDSQRHIRSLTIAFKADGNYILQLDDKEETSRAVPLDFEYRIDSRTPEHAKLELAKGGISVTGIKDTVPGVYLGFGGHFGPNTIQRFSNLVRENRETIVIKAIHDMFQQITNLTIADHLGSSTLFATVEGIPEQKLPLEIVSMGINKYLGIMLSILSSPKGVVLIDEIDSGLHHSQLIPIWKQLITLCKSNNVQIFATTHSGECITALEEALKDSEDDLRIIHLKRDNGASIAISFSGKDALCAIRQGFEVR